MLARGETLESGMDVPGLGVIEPDADARDIITDNLLEINASTVDDLAEKGL